MADETTNTEVGLTHEEVMAPLRAAWSDQTRADIEQLRAELAVQSKVRRARVELGLTQTQAAELTDFDQGDISKMESGRLTPSPKRLLRYLEALQRAAQRGIAAAVTTEPLITAQQAADYLLEIQSPTAKITQLKLQKLIYYGQGHALGLLNQRLFGEKIIRWQYGPVVPSLRVTYRDYGKEVLPLPEDFDVLSIPARARFALESAYAAYGEKDAGELVGRTHAEAPWKETPENEEISVAKIATFFQDELKAHPGRQG